MTTIKIPDVENAAEIREMAERLCGSIGESRPDIVLPALVAVIVAILCERPELREGVVMNALASDVHHLLSWRHLDLKPLDAHDQGVRNRYNGGPAP